MRVALVTSIARGGPVEHAVVLARELGVLGVEVCAVAATADVAARFEAAGARAAVLPLAPGIDAGGARAVRAWVRDADVVHTHDRRSGLWLRLAPRPRRSTALVHTAHGVPEPYLPPPAGVSRPGLRARVAYRGLERALARRCEAVVVPSRAARRALVARLGYDARALRVVENAIDLVPPLEQLGTRVGTLSVLEPVKGLDVFLRAAALVAEARDTARFVVHGSGPLEPALRRQASRTGLDGRIAFPGHVPARDALAGLGVHVVSSHFETSGLALMEAMAAGVPSVATRVGGLLEVAPADAVELVAPGDAGALAAAILRLLDDPNRARARARRARDAIERRPGPAAMARALLGVYEKALAAR